MFTHRLNRVTEAASKETSMQFMTFTSTTDTPLTGSALSLAYYQLYCPILTLALLWRPRGKNSIIITITMDTNTTARTATHTTERGLHAH